MPQIALNTYTIRQDLARDLPATLAAISPMGYAAIEAASLPHAYPIRDVRRILDDLGLTCLGTLAILSGLTGPALAGTIEYAHALGGRYVMLGYLFENQRPSTIDGWLRLADQLSGISAELRRAGLILGYHNHDFEFLPVQGRLPIDLIFQNVSPDVRMELDTANAFMTGADPADLIRRYPGRTTVIHLKDFPKDRLLGQGQIAWPEVLSACREVGGTEWYVVELEMEPQQPLAWAAPLLQTARAWLADA